MGFFGLGTRGGIDSVDAKGSMQADPKINLRIALVRTTNGCGGSMGDSKYGTLDRAGLPASLTPFAEKLLELHDRGTPPSKTPLKALREKPAVTASLNYLLELRKRSHEIFENRKRKKQGERPNVRDAKAVVPAPTQPLKAQKSFRVSSSETIKHK